MENLADKRYLEYKKLNLGCGFDKRQNYLNIDIHEFHKPDLVADISNLKMLPPDHFDEIVAQDVLEHIKRTETKNTLKEWNRLLRIGGILKLRVPNLIGLLSLFLQKENQTVIKQEELIQCCFGSQAYACDYHFTGFTELLISNYLWETGFIIDTIQTCDDWLFDITANKFQTCSFEHLLAIQQLDKFVTDSYLNILGRAPDMAGFQFFMTVLSENHITKTNFVEHLWHSDERKMLYSKEQKKVMKRNRRKKWRVW